MAGGAVDEGRLDRPFLVGDEPAFHGEPRASSRAATRAPEASSRTPAAAPSLAVMTSAERVGRSLTCA